MYYDELIALIAHDRDHVLPFIGAGLTLAAGAPDVSTLAGNLASWAAVDFDPNASTLTTVVRDAERSRGLPAVQEWVAETFSGLRLRSTPALTAICGVPGRRVLTTNYDDAIERAAIGRGLTPTTLLPGDARVVDDSPGENELYVVHLHGIPQEPTSIILPGRTMHHLESDSAFLRLVSAVMAPRMVVYLGFGLGIGEAHLHGIIKWLGEHLTKPREHYLLLPRSKIHQRRSELNELSTYGNLTTVSYADLCGHRDKSAYADSRVMPSRSSDRPWLLGSGWKSSA